MFIAFSWGLSWFMYRDPPDRGLSQRSPSESSDLFGLLPQLKGLFLDGGLCFLLHMIDIELLLKLQDGQTGSYWRRTRSC